MPKAKFPHLFQAGQIANVKIRNRTVMLPMGTAFAGLHGEVTQRTIDYFAERAKGGVGLIIAGNCSPSGRISNNGLVLDADWHMAGHYELVEAVHFHGARFCLQLNHPGREIYPTVLEGRQPVAPSALPCVFLGQYAYPTPRALERDEIYDIMDKFAAAAVRAKSVGYDMVELHGAHGYLIGQFMSAYMNKRTDEFGGSLENRMRFPIELIERIKQRVGPGYPIGIRISGEEFLDGGVTLKESPKMAQMLEEAGVAYINVSCGTYETLHISNDLMRDKEGWKLYIWEAIKKAVSIPTIAGGGLRTPAYLDQLIASNSADFVGMARPLLADPDLPNKARAGRLEDIRMCTSCMECLFGSPRRRLGGGARRCSVNPALGREREYAQLQPAPVKKKVVVIGAGPGGMEAARVAALRGHDVTLYDKGKALGGGLVLAGTPPGKEKWLTFRDWLATQIKKTKVRVRLNTSVTVAMVKKARPDVVIVGTGAEPLVPPIPGIESKNVVHAWDILKGKVQVNGRAVAVLGGGMVGCEVAELLAEKGNQVTIVEMLPTLACDMEPLNRTGLMRRLGELKISQLTGKEVVEITSGSAVVLDKKAGKKEKVAAETLVIAMGARATRGLADALEGKVPELYVIGDANEPRIILEATFEGSQVGRRI
ncbi:MAG: FAD-dependent oxidoreductase [Chloroflexi bacterium]|nr:FAD-dependent oxidoreductase [Chloroflexota bacterium]